MNHNSHFRVAIADDEPFSRARLGRLLSGIPEARVVVEAESGPELREALRRTPVDVVLLDIEMPEESGLETFGLMPLPRPDVVFVTAHSEFAATAYEVDAADYILKPISADRLLECFQRLRLRRLGSAALNETKAPGPANYLQSIAISMGRQVHLVKVAEIDYLLAQANYVEVHVAPRTFVMRGSLASLEERLDPGMFMRVHRSCIVRVDRIDSTVPLSSGRFELLLKSGARVRAGRTFREDIKSRLGLRRSL